MSLRPSELREVVEELSAQLASAIVQKAFSPWPRLVFLELRQVGRSTLLALSAEPELGRLSVVDERPVSPQTPPPFQARLRQELTGARLARVTLHAAARSVELAFVREEKPRSLWLELASGGGGNLVLVGAGKVLGFSAEPRQGLRVGAPYAPVEGQPAPPSAPSRLAPPPGEPLGFSRAAERLLSGKQVGLRAGELRRSLMAPLKAKLSRTQRTLEKVKAEARRQGEAEEHRRLGELLAQNLHRLSRGQKEISLIRYTEDGEVQERVAIDPRRSPKEEVEWRFHQYRRLLRGCEHAARRERELSAERDALQAQLDALANSPDEALVLRAAGGPPAPQKSAGDSPRARPYKEYLGSGGGRIWVGKGSEGNDALTFKIARPHDLWLHARGVPGSHVVLPLEKGTVLPQELLLDAAHLALHHSGAKGEPRGEVSYTQAKFVRKQKGGAKGQVIYTREKTLLLRVEPARLERLLRSAE